MEGLVNNFISNYDCSQYAFLPKFIKRRVDALKKLQLEHIQIQHQYYQKLQDLELEFEKLYKPIYERRTKIISGEHEPSDEECTLPAALANDGFNGDQENEDIAIKDMNPLKLTEEQEKELERTIKGVPGFWLGCLASTGHFSESIEEYDKPILRHLTDIRLTYAQEDEFLTYKLSFLFEENPYFTNKELTKTYYLKMKPDEDNPFAYEGFEVCKSLGCDINWNPGKRTDTKMVTVKQKNKTTGQVREKKKEVERDSFFLFFRTPKAPSQAPPAQLAVDPAADDEEEIMALMSFDFELGEIIRQSLVPKAPLYYTGYVMDVESDDEDDDDEYDDEEDSSDDDDGDDGIHEESSDGSESSELEDEEDEEDSLNESSDAKKATKKEA